MICASSLSAQQTLQVLRFVAVGVEGGEEEQEGTDCDEPDCFVPLAV